MIKFSSYDEISGTLNFLPVSLPWFDSQVILTFRKKYQTDFESHESPTGVEGEGGM